MSEATSTDAQITGSRVFDAKQARLTELQERARRLRDTLRIRYEDRLQPASDYQDPDDPSIRFQARDFAQRYDCLPIDLKDKNMVQVIIDNANHNPVPLASLGEVLDPPDEDKMKYKMHPPTSKDPNINVLFFVPAHRAGETPKYSEVPTFYFKRDMRKGGPIPVFDHVLDEHYQPVAPKGLVALIPKPVSPPK